MKSPKWHSYLVFVGGLLRARLRDTGKPSSTNLSDRLAWEKDIFTPYRYSALTFNYDTVIETCEEAFARSFRVDPQEPEMDPWDDFQLVKLHGSVSDRKVVPPTWNKAIHPETSQSWKKAFGLIRDAQHIRFVGYSLPVSDSYFRYLFKSALVASDHLKSIDAVALDKSGLVKARFQEFIGFKNFRFLDAEWGASLQRLFHLHQDGCGTIANSSSFLALEAWHKELFQNV